MFNNLNTQITKTVEILIPQVQNIKVIMCFNTIVQQYPHVVFDPWSYMEVPEPIPAIPMIHQVLILVKMRIDHRGNFNAFRLREPNLEIVLIIIYLTVTNCIIIQLISKNIL